MMNKKKYFRTGVTPWCWWLAIAAVLLIASGCSSGSESLSASGGIGGTGVTVGDVSDYGSIFVNGMELDTSHAEIYVEGALAGSGNEAARNLIPIGQRVVVQGDIQDDQNGTALRVDLFYYVQGPVWQVTRLDEQTVQLDVMGQTVFVEPQTTLAGVTVDSLAPDMVLQVSGTLDALGDIHAGHVALLAGNTAPDLVVLVKGRIQNLDTNTKHFQINDLLVDYSRVQNAAELVAEDHSVAVEGALNGEILLADSLRRFATDLFDSAEEFSMDGFITASLGVGLWRMGPYRIRIDAATWFEGIDPEELETGVRVVVQGRLRERLLDVRRVKAASRVRLESNVAAVDTANRTLILAGIDGLSIHLNPLTLIRGGALTLTGISPGDHVRVSAQHRQDGSVLAVDIFKNLTNAQDARYLLQGPVTGTADQQFELMGIGIDPYADGGIVFYDTDSVALTGEEFLSSLSIGSLARVTGRWEDGQLIYEIMAVIR